MPRKAIVAKYKKEHRCLLCCKSLNEDDIAYCTDCKKRRREARRQKKKEKICTHCHSRSAIFGYTECDICSLRNAAHHKRYRSQNPEVYRKSDKHRKKEYKKNNQCPMCSAVLDPDADKDHVCCVNCRQNLCKIPNYPKGDRYEINL